MKKNEQLMAKRLIEQTLTNWVNPELEKRKSENKLSPNFKLKAAQVIFSVGGTPLVRINNEVKAIVEAKLSRPIKKGEAIFNKDIEDIRSFRLVDEEKDFGHITVVRVTKGWFVGFSFIYDVSKSKELYDIGVEFMKSAYSDLQEKRYRPFVESLFVAVENLSKARIYLLPDQEIRKKRIKHSVVKKKVEMFSKTGDIIKIDHSNVFLELLKLRDQARYDTGFSMVAKEAVRLFQAVRGLSKEIFIILVRYGEIESNKTNGQKN